LHARVTKKNRQTNSLHVSSSRWRAYGAAGVTSALGNTGSAEAEIHYSGVLNHAFAGNHPLSTANFPLIGSAHLHFFRIANGSGGGTAGFTIPGSGSLLGSSVGAFAGSSPQPGNVYLSRLAVGVNVSQLRFKNSCHSKTYGDVSCYGAVIGRLDAIHGGFKRAGKGFIAFRHCRWSAIWLGSH